MSKTEFVPIGEAKGHPMLYWVGNRPLDYVTAFPAQLVETFNPTNACGPTTWTEWKLLWPKASSISGILKREQRVVVRVIWMSDRASLFKTFGSMLEE
jgi:hypothetical protein